MNTRKGDRVRHLECGDEVLATRLGGLLLVDERAVGVRVRQYPLLLRQRCPPLFQGEFRLCEGSLLRHRRPLFGRRRRLGSGPPAKEQILLFFDLSEPHFSGAAILIQ